MFLKIKLNTELKKDPANSTPRHIFKRTENISSQKNLYINWGRGRVLGIFWGAITKSAHGIRRNASNQEIGVRALSGVW